MSFDIVGNGVKVIVAGGLGKAVTVIIGTDVKVGTGEELGVSVFVGMPIGGDEMGGWTALLR